MTVRQDINYIALYRALWVVPSENPETLDASQAVPNVHYTLSEDRGADAIFALPDWRTFVILYANAERARTSMIRSQGILRKIKEILLFPELGMKHGETYS